MSLLLCVVLFLTLVSAADHCKFCQTLSSLIDSKDPQFSKSCRIACHNEWQLANCEDVCEKLQSKELTCDELPVCVFSKEKEPTTYGSQSTFQHQQEEKILRYFKNEVQKDDFSESFSRFTERERREINAMVSKIKKLEHNFEILSSEVSKLKEVIKGENWREPIRETIHSIEKLIHNHDEKRESIESKSLDVKHHVVEGNSQGGKGSSFQKTPEIIQVRKDPQEQEQNKQKIQKNEQQKENGGHIQELDLYYSYLSIILLAFMVFILKWRSEQYITAKQEQIFELEDPMPAFALFDTKEKLALLSVRVATILLCANVLGRELFIHIISFWSSGAFQGLRVSAQSFLNLSTLEHGYLLLLFGVVAGLHAFVIFNEGLYKLPTLDFNKWIRLSMTLATIGIAFFGISDYKYAVYVILMVEYSNLIAAILYVNLFGKTLLDLFFLNDSNPLWVAFLDVAHKIKLYPILENIINVLMSAGYESNFAASVWMLFFLYIADISNIMRLMLFPQQKPSSDS